MIVTESRWSALARGLFYAGLLAHFVFVMTVLRRVPGMGDGVLLLLAGYALAVAFAGAFMTLRVTVDGTDLRVGFRLFGRRIPLHEIDRISPVRYRWLEWGGWGIRRKRGGAVLYNVPGDQGRAVELILRDGKRVLFSAEDPEAACTAIRERRALMPY